jgi:hypothetical protein
MFDLSDLEVVKTSFPHIAKIITLLWGNQECHDYLHKLFTETRDGKRQGFPLRVFLALNSLMLQHRVEFPQFIKPTDIWDTR